MHGLRDGPFTLFHLPGGGWMGCGVAHGAWRGKIMDSVRCTYVVSIVYVRTPALVANDDDAALLGSYVYECYADCQALQKLS